MKYPPPEEASPALVRIRLVRYCLLAWALLLALAWLGCHAR